MRKCTTCNEEVKIGYYAAGEYYCSDDCLTKDFTKEEWNNLYDENDDEYYWTMFED